MKFILLFCAFLCTAPSSTDTWGKTGHRVVGDIAAHYLNNKAKKAVRRILGNKSMALASIWMDKIRSDPAYDHTHDWHWVTIPEGKTYAETEKNPNGNLIGTLQTIIRDLKKSSLNSQEEAKKLKMLIHLVGDIHQPLHVGTGKDKGGNDIFVKWFWEPSNLHRVWDSGMIDETKLSYTELSESINYPTREQVRQWQNSEVLDWVRESMELRDEVYNLPDHRNINYEYMYHHLGIVEKRLLQAGVRLAGVLNEIYG